MTHGNQLGLSAFARHCYLLCGIRVVRHFFSSGNQQTVRIWELNTARGVILERPRGGRGYPLEAKYYQGTEVQSEIRKRTASLKYNFISYSVLKMYSWARDMNNPETVSCGKDDPRIV